VNLVLLVEQDRDLAMPLDPRDRLVHDPAELLRMLGGIEV
jgi:hypothetical protein